VTVTSVIRAKAAAEVSTLKVSGVSTAAGVKTTVQAAVLPLLEQEFVPAPNASPSILLAVVISLAVPPATVTTAFFYANA